MSVVEETSNVSGSTEGQTDNDETLGHAANENCRPVIVSDVTRHCQSYGADQSRGGLIS